MKFNLKIVFPIAILRDLEPHKTFAEKRQTVKDFRNIERELREQGIKVWLAWTKKTNGMMLRILKHIRAKPYFSDEENIYFVKDLEV